MTETNTPTMEERARRSGLDIVHFDPEGDPAFQRDPHAMWDLAAEHGELFFSTAARGFFVASRYETCRQVLQDPITFSSANHVAFTREPIELHVIPLTYDPPEHTAYRKVLNPLFSPPVVAAREARIRSTIRAMIDRIAEQSTIELVQDFAIRLPAVVFLEWMGLDVNELDRFTHLAYRISFEQFESKEKQAEIDAEMHAILDDLFAARRARPADDLATQLLDARIDGRELSDQELREIGHLLFNAGLETTAMVLSFMFLHLAEHPADRQRILDEPGIIETAVEELLRVYATIGIVGRRVTADTEVAGCPMHPGDRIFVATPSANRHLPEDRPADVVLDRWPNRHTIFGLGPHRCVGSHLARAELRIALEEWHRRIPNYRLVPGTELRYHGSFQQRPVEVPLEILEVTDES